MKKNLLKLDLTCQSSLEGNSWHIPQQSHRKKYVCITKKSEHDQFHVGKWQNLILIFFMEMEKDDQSQNEW